MKEIKIKADSWRLSPCWAVAGTRSSFGMSRITFDFSPEWDELGKRVTFFPADGSEAVALIVTADSVIIPDEVMANAGTAEFVVDGEDLRGGRLVSERGELRVVDTAEPGGREPKTLTPTENEQLRAEIGFLRAEIERLKEGR